MRVAAAGFDITAVLGRQEVGNPALNDAQAVFGQLEVANHFWIEKRDRVRGDGVAESWVELLRDRGTADHPAPLQDGYFESTRSKIGGADEPIVPTTDDQRIGPRG